MLPSCRIPSSSGYSWIPRQAEHDFLNYMSHEGFRHLQCPVIDVQFPFHWCMLLQYPFQAYDRIQHPPRGNQQGANNVHLPALKSGGSQAAACLITSNYIEHCSCRHELHVGTLTPSDSTNLSRFGSCDYCMSAGDQLSSPIASGLSSNSTSTTLGPSYVGSPTQPLALRPRHTSTANPSQSWGPNPMLGLDWLPQNSGLAAQLGQSRNDRMQPCVIPVDALEGLWGFDEFPPIPGS